MDGLLHAAYVKVVVVGVCVCVCVSVAIVVVDGGGSCFVGGWLCVVG